MLSLIHYTILQPLFDPMETIISATIGELITRSISFFIDQYLKPEPSKKSIKQLQWVLLRIRVTIEEAERRCITNQAMLQQLNILRRVMYKGLILCVPEEEKDKKEHAVSSSLSLSLFSPSKRVRFSTGSKYGTENSLREMLESLEITMAGMSEFLIFLRNCPPMFRQPYSTYLFIEKCMFGRQMEMQRVVNFLLYEEPPVHGNFGVLPIVGPGKVGKTTLVEHVCCDERVRNHFSHVIFLSNNDFREENPLNIRDATSRIKHQHGGSSEEKFLVIIELVGKIDECAWRRFHSASQSSIPRGRKVLITSRSEDIINFGTTQDLRMMFWSREAYWYFFKALVFGSTDPEEQPRFASIAKAIFDEYFDHDTHKAFAGPFISLNRIAVGLKSSVNVQNWNRFLSSLKDIRRQNEPGFRAGLSDWRTNDDDFLLQRVVNPTQYYVIHNHDRIALATETAPKITFDDILGGIGSVTPHSKFEILVWESHLPPYHKYIYSCQILEFDCKVSGKRLGQKRKVSSY